MRVRSMVLTGDVAAMFRRAGDDGQPNLLVFSICDACDAFGGEHALRSCNGSMGIDIVRADDSDLSESETQRIASLLVSLADDESYPGLENVPGFGTHG